MTLKARVKAGRLVIDEPTELRSIRLSRIRTRTSRPHGSSTQKSSFANFARVEESTASLHGHCTRARSLRRIHAHLYYTFDEDEVMIRALWGARRERGPRI